MRKSGGLSFIQLRPMPGPVYLRSSRASLDAGYTLALPPSWRCPRPYLPSPLVSACGRPLTPAGSSLLPMLWLDSTAQGLIEKLTALHQPSATDRTAGTQSLFLYFLLGLYTPALSASDLKPCKRCAVFYGVWSWTSPWCPLLPPTLRGGPHALSVTLLQLISFQ